jgi:hypothetical protein
MVSHSRGFVTWTVDQSSYELVDTVGSGHRHQDTSLSDRPEDQLLSSGDPNENNLQKQTSYAYVLPSSPYNSSTLSVAQSLQESKDITDSNYDPNGTIPTERDDHPLLTNGNNGESISQRLVEFSNHPVDQEDVSIEQKRKRMIRL